MTVDIEATLKREYPRMSTMLNRILGKDRKGRPPAQITTDKTLLWREVERLVNDYKRLCSFDWHDPYAQIREALETRVAELEVSLLETAADLSACENRRAGLERLVAAGRLAGDAWAACPNRITPELEKSLNRLAMIAGTVTDTTPEETAP